MFKYDDRFSSKVYPYYKTKVKYQKLVNLMYIEHNGKFHYILIKSLESLFNARTNYKKKQPTCPECFQRFRSIQRFVRHMKACMSETGQIMIMPNDDETVKFKNFQYRYPNVATICHVLTLNWFHETHATKPA